MLQVLAAPAVTPADATAPSPRRGVLRLGLAAVGGVLAEVAFPDRGWWPVGFVAVAMLVLAGSRGGGRTTALVWFAWGQTFFLLHLGWAREAAGPVAWVALSVLQAGLLAVAGALWSWADRAAILARRPMLRALVFASVWVAGEQLRSVWPFGGFPWGRLAFSQTDGPLLSLAWLGGAPLVSFAVAFIGALLALATVAAGRRAARRVLVAASLTGAMLGLGTLIPLGVEPEAGTLRTGVVQGNVPADRGRPDRAEVVLANHVQGTAAVATQAPGGLDLVVWPENASDVDPRTNADAAAQVWEASDAVRAPILVGTDRYEPEGRYNDVVVWDPERGPVDSYAKQRPAPFGEYVPLRGLIRVFSSQVDRVEVDMVAGTAPAVVDIPVARLGRAVPVATVICFEVAFDDLVRNAVRQGAQVLVVPTNNASFGWTAQSTQQLAMSRLRAVETGRATIQASTVGVSAVIEPDGTLVQRTDLFTSATMTADLPLRTSLTPAVRAGPAPIILAVLIAAAAAASGAANAWRRRADRSSRPASQAHTPASPEHEEYQPT